MYVSHLILYLRYKFHVNIPDDCQDIANLLLGYFNLGHPVYEKFTYCRHLLEFIQITGFIHTVGVVEYRVRLLLELQKSQDACAFKLYTATEHSTEWSRK